MNSLMKLTFIDMKLYFRNYVAIFFTLVFPVLMLLLFGGIYGNQPVACLRRVRFGRYHHTGVHRHHRHRHDCLLEPADGYAPPSASWACCGGCAPPRSIRGWC